MIFCIYLKKILKKIFEDRLTYNRKWNYIWLIIDLFNREIIRYAAGENKNAELVYKAFETIKTNLNNINIFHTDRGNEFKNKIIDEVLTTFNIDRSLSKKGCPYDNAVAEATYKIIKTEFAFNRIFESFEELETELFDYVNWYNNFRIHSSLDYLTPVEYRVVNEENVFIKKQPPLRQNLFYFIKKMVVVVYITTYFIAKNL